MAAPPVAQHKIAAALAAIAAGSTVADAAAAYGVSLATLKRYRSGKGAPAGVKPTKAPAKSAKPAATHSRASAGPSRDQPADDSPDESLLETLHAELRDARRERRQASDDSARRQWSKTIRDLVTTIERIAPPPPPPPDLLLAELRRLDGEVLARIEAHAAEPITIGEVAA